MFCFQNLKYFSRLKEDGDLVQAVLFFNRPKIYGRHIESCRACITRHGFMLMSCSKVMSGVIHPFIEDE
jgi:hypothetical protein